MIRLVRCEKSEKTFGELKVGGAFLIVGNSNYVYVKIRWGHSSRLNALAIHESGCELAYLREVTLVNEVNLEVRIVK